MSVVAAALTWCSHCSFAVSIACLQYRSWMRFGVRKPLKTSSYPAYIYINFDKSLTFYYDFMKFTASTGLYKIPASKGPAGESVKFDGVVCGCWFPSCSCRLHWHRQVLPCRHNKHKDQGSRLSCTTLRWLSGCPPLFPTVQKKDTRFCSGFPAHGLSWSPTSPSVVWQWLWTCIFVLVISLN